MKSQKNKNLKEDAGFDIPDEAFEPRNYKQRVSIMVQGNILEWYKQLAEVTGVPYQNLMQMALARFKIDHLTDVLQDDLDKLKRA